jgi:hypothetical protein
MGAMTRLSGKRNPVTEGRRGIGAVIACQRTSNVDHVELARVGWIVSTPKMVDPAIVEGS